MNSDEIFYDVYDRIEKKIYDDIKYLLEHKYIIFDNIRSSLINYLKKSSLYLRSIFVYMLVIIRDINNDINIIREKNSKPSLSAIVDYYDK